MSISNKSAPVPTGDLFSLPAPPLQTGSDLMLVAAAGHALSPAQAEFNRLMKRLSNERAKQQKERLRMEDLLQTYNASVFPELRKCQELHCRCVKVSVEIWRTAKFTPRRRKALGEFLGMQAEALAGDISALTVEEAEEMEKIADELLKSAREESREEDEAEFADLRAFVENLARQRGLNVDFSDIRMDEHPEVVARKLEEKMAAAMAAAAAEGGALPDDAGQAAPSRPARKKSKAQQAKEARQQAAEEAKATDLKTLYKQLARALHPDLESDPVLKLQKEEWMKRLTAANSRGDLRELLSIEMEWLGAEASNLSAATDGKLKVYCAVLKEQIAEEKEKTAGIPFQPEFRILDRFRNPFTGMVPPAAALRSHLSGEIAVAEERLGILLTDTPARMRLLNSAADGQARAAAAPRGPFF